MLPSTGATEKSTSQSRPEGLGNWVRVFLANQSCIVSDLVPYDGIEKECFREGVVLWKELLVHSLQP